MSDYSSNPYSSPSDPGHNYTPGSNVSGKVMGPAIGLAVCGGLSALHALYGMVRNVTGLNNRDDGPPPNIQDNEALMELYRAMEPYDGLINITMSIVMLIVSLLILMGGLRMMKLKNYGLCVTTAILAICPCIWICGCCGIGNGIGIWALVVLMSADVKAAFH